MQQETVSQIKPDHALLEVIGFSLEACEVAQDAGAGRIELCAGPGEGGTTPSCGFIAAARNLLSIPLYVMIRPRGGDFLYSQAEFEQMKTDILTCRQLGCDGIVTGMLLENGSVDQPRMKQLMELAYPMEVSFHRAFDRCASPFETLEQIIALGCERILTSGQQPSAMEGAVLIRDLIRLADGRLVIMPGSGIRSNNIRQLAQSTGAIEFHASAKTIQKSGMKYSNDALKDDHSFISVDGQEISRMVQLLKEMPLPAAVDR